MEPKRNNVDENYKKKQDEILSEASKLFWEKGFNGTSMQEIATKVGMLKGSIYYYFNSKNEILREVLNKGITPVLKNAEYIFNKELPPKEKFAQLIENHVRYIMNKNFSLVIYFQERDTLSANQTKSYVENRKRYEKMFRDVMEEGIKKGDFPAVDIPLTVLSILGMCNWIVQWYNPKGPKTPEEITDHMNYLICDLMLKNNPAQ